MAEAAYRVTGRVQGVGFRWWTRATGTRLGLSGTVRNLDDGAVVVHARGEASSLAELRRCLAVGPPLARVESVEPVSYSPEGVRDGEFVAVR